MKRRGFTLIELISVLILLGAFRLVSETVNVLMESVPSGVVLEEL